MRIDKAKFVPYITLEGIDGAGKTTQCAALAVAFMDSAVTPVRLAEPTRTPLGLEALASLSAPVERRDIEKERELFTRDRQAHVSERIAPLLGLIAEGHPFVIIQDRYYLSAPAYQARSQSELRPLLREQQAFSPKPDLVILLDVPVDIALERVLQRDGTFGPRQTRGNLSQARDNYLTLSTEQSERIEVIDASKTPEEVFNRVCQLTGIGE